MQSIDCRAMSAISRSGNAALHVRDRRGGTPLTGFASSVGGRAGEVCEIDTGSGWRSRSRWRAGTIIILLRPGIDERRSRPKSYWKTIRHGLACGFLGLPADLRVGRLVVEHLAGFSGLPLPRHESGSGEALPVGQLRENAAALRCACVTVPAALPSPALLFSFTQYDVT